MAQYQIKRDKVTGKWDLFDSHGIKWLFGYSTPQECGKDWVEYLKEQGTDLSTVQTEIHY